MQIRNYLTFASDAEWVAMIGAAFLGLSIVALFAERSRVRRNRIEQVGFMPWTAVFLGSALIGSSLVLMGLTGILRG